MNVTHLEANMVPLQLRGGYSGKMFKAVVGLTVTIPADAGLYSSGTRETFRAINFETGEQATIPGQELSPWDDRRERTVALAPGFAVVRHSIFQGKDMGLTFFIHPDNAAKLLPAPAGELSAYEKLVLVATRSLKSSYGGKDRYQMAADEYDCKQALAGLPYPTREQWDAAKASLIEKRLLNKAGAITPAGRNAS